MSDDLQDVLDGFDDSGLLRDGVYVLKQDRVDAVVAPSALSADAGKADAFAKARIIKPPYDPEYLTKIWENSGSLQPNIAAYETNIDGTGHIYVPVVDFDGDVARDRVRESMWLARDNPALPIDIIPDEDVIAQLRTLKREATAEHMQLTSFFANVNPDGSFVGLRRITRQDLEITGNAYWECLRNQRGKPARFRHVPSTSVRLGCVDDAPVQVTDRAAGLLHWDEVTQYRYFRRYVQKVGSVCVYFKEFGDPRVVSRMTGKAYADMAEFTSKARKGDQPANEMLHFKVNKGGEAYGVPRWIGNLLAVLGSRAADEVNYDYFDHKAIPPMVVMVMGARMGADDVSKIQTYFTNMAKGRQNFHRVLVMQANLTKGESLAGVTTSPKIEFKDLSGSQESDAQFKDYDERNIDKVGGSFRLPRLLRGDVRDFNKGTAAASLRFAEDQVFEPERAEFDSIINRRVLPELGIRLYRFRSMGLVTRDPEVVGETVDRLVRTAVIMPNEGRSIMASSFGVELPAIDADWARQPLPLTIAGMNVRGVGEPSPLDPRPKPAPATAPIPGTAASPSTDDAAPSPLDVVSPPPKPATGTGPTNDPSAPAATSGTGQAQG